MDFNWQRAKVDILIHQQSRDIAQGVDAHGNRTRAPATRASCSATPARRRRSSCRPLFSTPQHTSFAVRGAPFRRRTRLGPDAKSQVTLQYENGKPVGAHVRRRLHSAQRRSRSASGARDRSPHVLNVLPKGWMCAEEDFYVNPTGRFVVGGPRWRCRDHRTQDHRRYLWRRGTPWRRRLFGQGSHQGRIVPPPMRPDTWPRTWLPRACRALHDPAQLRHRRVQAALCLYRNP